MKLAIECLREFSVGAPAVQLRAALFADGVRTGMIVVHADTPDQQPSPEQFRWPRDTLKISAFSFKGECLWRHDVGRGVIPGLWFCPILPFDLDGDGQDEIYHVGNPSQETPFNKDTMELVALSCRTGKVLRSAPWPWFIGNQPLTDTFRYFIHGGYSQGRARLITAQGTYHELSIHGWDGNLKLLWKRDIHENEAGCRASHMISVLDLDGDGRDEVLWGERCLDIDTGADKWVADRDGYHGHSDVVMPTLDRRTGRWSIYTCREFPWPEGSRGVVMFDDQGRELWGHRGMGHMHDGWTARLCDDGTHRCYAMEMLTDKSRGRGSWRLTTRHFLYDLSGRSLEVPFPIQATLPIDIDGDGRHELVYCTMHPFVGNMEGREGLVVDCHGKELGRVTGEPGVLPKAKLLDCPGEQIMTSDAAGTIRIYGCPGAVDTPEARARYAHPYYRSCQRLTAVGYNWRNLGGL